MRNMWFRRGRVRGTPGRKAKPVRHRLEQTRSGRFPSGACEAEYNKFVGLVESGELDKQPPGLTGEELSTYLNELEHRLYG